MRFAFILQKSKTKIGKKKYTISKRPKSFPIGTIRSWGGIKYQKVSPIKWSAVAGQSGLNMAKMTSKDIKRLKKNKQLRDKFVLENQAFVHGQLKGIRQYVKDYDDLSQTANVGFLEAINRFDTKQSPKAFIDFARKYIKGYVYHDLSREKNKNLSTNIKFGDEGIKEAEETIPSKSHEIEDVELKQIIDKMKDELKSPQAKKILDMMAKGYHKSEIAKKMKTSKANITQIVARRIKPVAEKYLMKSEKFSIFLDMIDYFILQED